MHIVHLETGRHVYGGARQVLLLVRGLQARGVEGTLVCTAGGTVAAEAAASASRSATCHGRRPRPALHPSLRPAARASSARTCSTSTAAAARTGSAAAPPAGPASPPCSPAGWTAREARRRRAQVPALRTGHRHLRRDPPAARAGRRGAARAWRSSAAPWTPRCRARLVPGAARAGVRARPALPARRLHRPAHSPQGPRAADRGLARRRRGLPGRAPAALRPGPAGARGCAASIEGRRPRGLGHPRRVPPRPAGIPRPPRPAGPPGAGRGAGARGAGGPGRRRAGGGVSRRRRAGDRGRRAHRATWCAPAMRRRWQSRSPSCSRTTPRRRAFGEAAWAWVAREFRVADMVGAHLTLYRDLIETRNRHEATSIGRSAELVRRIAAALSAKSARVAVAESCTGGWIAKSPDRPARQLRLVRLWLRHLQRRGQAGAARRQRRDARRAGRRERGRGRADGDRRAPGERRGNRRRGHRHRGAGRRLGGQARRHRLLRLGRARRAARQRHPPLPRRPRGDPPPERDRGAGGRARPADGA